MKIGAVFGRSGRNEDLIAPENGQTALAGRRVRTRLADNALQNRNGWFLSSDFYAARQLYTRLVVILASRQRRKARSLPSGMVQSRTDSPALQPLRKRAPSNFVSFLVRVERSETVASASFPVLIDADDFGPLFEDGANDVIEALIPIFGLSSRAGTLPISIFHEIWRKT